MTWRFAALLPPLWLAGPATAQTVAIDTPTQGVALPSTAVGSVTVNALGKRTRGLFKHHNGVVYVRLVNTSAVPSTRTSGQLLFSPLQDQADDPPSIVDFDLPDDGQGIALVIEPLEPGESRDMGLVHRGRTFDFGGGDFHWFRETDLTEMRIAFVPEAAQPAETSP
ncbi:MAG: hypothetical protein KC912_23735 [Proteobacteria bacterium]|nr:hypothetical protein [Pseudomonadota bacterium]